MKNIGTQLNDYLTEEFPGDLPIAQEILLRRFFLKGVEVTIKHFAVDLPKVPENPTAEEMIKATTLYVHVVSGHLATVAKEWMMLKEILNEQIKEYQARMKAEEKPEKLQ